MAETVLPTAQQPIVTLDEYMTLFQHFRSSGVLAEVADQLSIYANSTGMNVTLRVGHALLRGSIYRNSSEIVWSVNAAHATLPRIDHFALRYNTALVPPTQRLYLPGTPAASPTVPSLNPPSALQEEISLATVLVPAGAVSITAANVTDTRVFSRHYDASRLVGRVPGAAAGNLPILDAAGRVVLSNAPNPPRVYAYHSVAQSVPNATFATVLIDSERYDTDNFHFAGAGSNGITIPITGTYHLGAELVWSAGTGDRAGLIMLAGAEVARQSFLAGANTSCGLNWGTEQVCTAGQVISVQAFQQSGGALSLISAILRATYIGP